MVWKSGEVMELFGDAGVLAWVNNELANGNRAGIIDAFDRVG